MLSNFLKSTILSKILVAVTGLLLVLFIVGHTLGNLLVYLGPNAINTYALGLKKLGALLWVVRGGLIFAVLIHIIATIRLTLYNKTAKPINYTVTGYITSTFSSRTMAIAGLTILFFVIYHLLHFTLGVTNPEFMKLETNLHGENVHDVFTMMITGFRNPLVSGFYILAVSFLGLHLNHGVKSLFHTLGIAGPIFTPMIAKISTVFAIVICGALISIPISVMLRIVGGAI
ncbi:MAG: succinate dehydrogenase cytochrome b subunit [Candidatus Kapabacteria bacterium]|nr:succinate dehydrogenase cytochrome b subunit [Candidatus Kapabacteria bacterium]